MEAEVLCDGWIKQGSVIAFPFEWQRPAKTEEWVFETLIQKNVHSRYVEFISFPWATLIDLIDRKKIDKAKLLINSLRKIPPKKKLLRFSACQHIRLHVIERYLVDLKITDIFWSHKTLETNRLGDIHVHPLPLYPVAYFEKNSPKYISITDRRYLFGFIGAYDEACYLSDIRRKIFSISKGNNRYIERRSEWHFNLDVYQSQIDGKTLTEDQIALVGARSNEYSSVLMNTFYSLCPSGSGPNSIRLWESLAFGCCPIVLSDHLDMPKLPASVKYLKMLESEFPAKLNEAIRSSPTLNEEIYFSNDVSSIFLADLLDMITCNAWILQAVRDRS